MKPHHRHGSTSLAMLLLRATTDVARAFAVPSGSISHIASPTRRTSILPPLHYLSSEDERDTPPSTRHKIIFPKKQAQRSFLHRLDRFLTDLQMTRDHLRTHPFLSGNYAPVDKENFGLEVEVVEGEIPKGIWGAYFRNGPNPKRDWLRKRYHWFDGHAMLHTLVFKDGKATYSNQFVPSPRFQVEQELGEEFFQNIGEYVGVIGLIKALIGKHLVREKLDDEMKSLPPNTSIMMYNNKFYCLHEASLPMECRMHRDGRLEYIRHETFDSSLDYPFTAHPIKDGDDLLFNSYATDREVTKQHGTMKVGVHNSQTNVVVPYFVPISDTSHISFAHSFAHTENYIIIWDSSVHFDHSAIFTGGAFFRFNNNHNLKFGLVPKDATCQEDVIWIDSGEPGAILHQLHAWEEVEEKYLHGDKISSRTIIKLWTPLSQDFSMDIEKNNTFRMAEFIIDVQERKAVHEIVHHSMNVEMSVMPPPLSDKMTPDEDFTSCAISMTNSQNQELSDKVSIRCTSTLSSAERFGFTAIQEFEDSGEFVGYAQWDMINRRLASTVRFRGGEIGGEPVIIRDTELDKVYVGSYVYNKEEDQSYFVLYDSKTDQSVCRLKMPQRVPQGIHGTFVSGEELESHFRHHEKRSMIFDSELWERLFQNSQQG